MNNIYESKIYLKKREIITISNKFVFSLSAPTHPQNPIINTNKPTTKKTNAGSNKTPIDIVVNLLNVSFSIHAYIPIPKTAKPTSFCLFKKIIIF